MLAGNLLDFRTSVIEHPSWTEKLGTRSTRLVFTTLQQFVSQSDVYVMGERRNSSQQRTSSTANNFRHYHCTTTMLWRKTIFPGALTKFVCMQLETGNIAILKITFSLISECRHLSNRIQCMRPRTFLRNIKLCVNIIIIIIV